MKRDILILWAPNIFMILWNYWTTYPIFLEITNITLLSCQWKVQGTSLVSPTSKLQFTFLVIERKPSDINLFNNKKFHMMRKIKFENITVADWNMKIISYLTSRFEYSRRYVATSTVVSYNNINWICWIEFLWSWIVH